MPDAWQPFFDVVKRFQSLLSVIVVGVGVLIAHINAINKVEGNAAWNMRQDESIKSMQETLRNMERARTGDRELVIAIRNDVQWIKEALSKPK